MANELTGPVIGQRVLRRDSSLNCIFSKSHAFVRQINKTHQFSFELNQCSGRPRHQRWMEAFV